MDVQLRIMGRSYKVEHVTTNLMSRRKGKIAPPHCHPVFHIIYITEGRGVFDIDGHVSYAEEGFLYIINPNEWHAFSGSEEDPLSDLESTFLLLDTEGPAVLNFFEIIERHRQVRLPAALKRAPLVVPAGLRPLLVEGFQRILGSQGAFFTKEHFGVMILDLLSRTEEIVMRMNGFEPARPDASIDSAHATVAGLKRFLHACIGRPVTLRELANSAHLTPNYLCRLFKEHTGETPMGYLQNIRLREAAKLLAHTDLPVYMIAEKLAYEEPSYFARLFRKRYGVSPTVYRRARWSSGNRIK